MNIFKVGRGDFFGILIPGAFLLINILLFYYNVFDTIPDWLKLSTNPTNSSKPPVATTILNTILIPSLIVLSYILGFFLRSISPSLTEKLTLIVWYPLCAFQAVFVYFFRNKENQEVKNRSLIEVYKQIINIKLEPFPYIDWFYDKYLKKSPLSYKQFYENLIRRVWQ